MLLRGINRRNLTGGAGGAAHGGVLTTETTGPGFIPASQEKAIDVKAIAGLSIPSKAESKVLGHRPQAGFFWENQHVDRMKREAPSGFPPSP